MTEDEKLKMLKEMKIHEWVTLDNVTIMRVYKGWLYTIKDKQLCDGAGYQFQMTTTFVPYN